MSSYFLGLDISKGYSDFIMLDQDKRPVIDGFQLDDTAEGHAALTTFLESFLNSRPDAQIYVGLESTGGYENNWFNHLCNLKDSMPLKVARLNPARVTSNSEAAARHNKTDKISATDVANYLISHPDKVNYESADPYTMLRCGLFSKKQESSLFLGCSPFLQTKRRRQLRFPHEQKRPFRASCYTLHGCLERRSIQPGYQRGLRQM